MIDDAKAAVDGIIAKCDHTVELERHVVYYSSALAYLICHMAKENGKGEEGIRAIYRTFSEMAVTEFETPQRPRVLH